MENADKIRAQRDMAVKIDSKLVVLGYLEQKNGMFSMRISKIKEQNDVPELTIHLLIWAKIVAKRDEKEISQQKKGMNNCQPSSFQEQKHVTQQKLGMKKQQY